MGTGVAVASIGIVAFWHPTTGGRPARPRERKAQMDLRLNGRPIEITRAEARELAELAEQMYRQSLLQEKGWFLAYFQAHRAAFRIFRAIIQRSHAN